MSYLPYAYGAAVSWCVSENRDIDIARAVSVHFFGDASGDTGKLFYDLGNVYTKIPFLPHNGTPYGYGVVSKEDDLKIDGGRLKNKLDRAVATKVAKEIDRLGAQARTLKMARPDAALIKREILYVLALMRHGMSRIERVQAKKQTADAKSLRAAQRKLVAEHNKVWLARNRPGGMDDSAANIRA